MFSRTKTAPQARSATATSGRSAIPSLLSADICIKGDIRSSGEVQVDGTVEGDIVAECLVVSEVGTVSGTIAAGSVRILGTVSGTITAGSIKLARTARVTGDIVHEALSIEEGAFVLGHCRRAEPEVRPALDGASVAVEVDAAPPSPVERALPADLIETVAEDRTAQDDVATALDEAVTIPAAR